MTGRDVFGERFLEPDENIFTHRDPGSGSEEPTPDQCTRTKTHIPAGWATLSHLLVGVCVAATLFATDPAGAASPPTRAPTPAAESRSSPDGQADASAAERAELAGWSEYLGNLHTAGFTESHAALVQQLWDELQASTSGAMPVPQAAPTPEGAILLSWDRGEHHVDVEVYGSGELEWFYMNRETKLTESFDGLSEDGPPASFRRLVRLLLPGQA